jgi:hypothetical protein
MTAVDQGETLPANKRNKYGEGAENVGEESGDKGFDTEAEARSSLRTSSMHGKDHAGRTHETVARRVGKQFPHINESTHSGMHREMGTSVHAASGPEKSMGHSEASAKRSGLSFVAPKVIPENMGGSQPSDSSSEMADTGEISSGDQSYLDV